MVDVYPSTDCESESEVTKWCRQALTEWLTNPDASILRDWLSGNGLPPIGHDEPPYVWIMRSLPLDGDRFHAERSLAIAAAQILREFVTDSKSQRDLTLMVYNLRLCAGVAFPDVLNEPLLELLGSAATDCANDSDWGDDFKNALRDALIYNQLDSRLLPCWQAMLTATPAFLPGNVFDGFFGMLYVPRSEQQRGEPNIELLSNALLACTEVLCDAANRRIEFRLLLDRVWNTYPDIHWAQTFIEMADSAEWDTWAVESLPSLCVPCLPHAGEDQSDYVDVYVWKHIYAILSETAGIEVIYSLCRGYVLRIRIKTADLAVLQFAAGNLESLRSTNPYGSDTSMIGIVVDALDRLAIDLENDDDIVSSTEPATTTHSRLPQANIGDVGRIVPIERLHGVHRELLRKNDLVISL